MGLRDINWGCLKCKDFKKRDGCYECNIQKSFPSWSNIAWNTPVVKNFLSLRDNIRYKIQDRIYEKEFISDTETTKMKLIWGLQSFWTQPTDHPTLYGMNDFKLIYDKVKKKYYIGVETMFWFDDWENGPKESLRELLTLFTEWMKENSYNINGSVGFSGLFSDGINPSEGYDSIEEAYESFKFLVEGYCNS